MKILLVKPPTSPKLIPGDDLFMSEPLELAYVGAGVSDKYEVKILDMRLDKELEKMLTQFKPAIVGLTAYTSQVSTVIDIAKAIKKINPGIINVVGGHHATMVPEDFNVPALDIVVIGEGVFTFREIVDNISAGKSYNHVEGLAYRADGKLNYSPAKSYPNLDVFPFPDRSLIAQYSDNYFLETSDGIFKPLVTVRTSKGCPFRCKFCALWKITEGRYLARDPEKILEELKTIKTRYIDLGDDETFIDIKRMDKLADLLIEAGLDKQFSSSVRSDTVIAHPELFKKWKKAGLSRVLIGLESNRPKDLEYFNKKNTTANNEEAIKILRSLGVKIDASFIIPPDYDIEDFDNLANYAKKLEADFVMCIPLTPLPGTDLFIELKDKLITHDYQLFDLSHVVLPTKLPIEKFYKELAYLYYRINKSLGVSNNKAHVAKFQKLHKEIKYRYKHHLEA